MRLGTNLGIVTLDQTRESLDPKLGGLILTGGSGDR